MREPVNTERELRRFYYESQSFEFAKCVFPIEPACPASAIRAHSIQNRGVLGDLCENGHVVMIRPRPDHVHGPSLSFELVGRRDATTFTGLCADHDSSIFRPIDTKPLDVDNPEHLFLVAYRSVLREHSTRNAAAKLLHTGIEKLADVGVIDRDSASEPVTQTTWRMYEAWGFFRYTCIFHEAFFDQRWDAIIHRIVELPPAAAEFACSGIIDNLGASRLVRHVRDPMCAALNVFPHGDRTLAVFSFPREHRDHWMAHTEPYVTAQGSFAKYLVSKLVLKQCENFVIAPGFFAKFSEAKKAKLLQYFEEHLLAGQPDNDHSDLSLFEC